MRRKTGRFLAGCMAAFVAMTSSYAPVAAEETDSVIAPKEGAYGYYVENSEKNKNIKDGSSPDLDPSVNPSTGLLSGYLDLWTPGDLWSNGTKKNETILNENISKAYAIAQSRTTEQAQAAYDDEFNNQNYSMVSGLGSYAEDFIAKSGIGTDKTKWEKNTDAELYDVYDLVDLFRNRTAASTNGAKTYYRYPRPYRWDLATQSVLTETTEQDGTTYYTYAEDQVVPEIAAKKNLATKNPTEDGGFPSGHTNAAYLAAYALAYAIPEQYDALLMRAADLGNNRIVAGMHSPLDVMGGRMTATAVATAALYNDNGVAADKAYTTAHTSLVTETNIATADAAAYQAYKEQLAKYIYYLTYDFEQIGDTTKSMTVPKGAELLLKTRLPYLSDKERRYVLYTTGLESGYPLLDDAEGWGRLNLYAAAHGYGALVKDTTVTMDASQGGFSAKDNWLNDIGGTGALTKDGTGELVLAGTNSYTGGTTVAGGTLTVTNKNALGTGSVTNESVLKEEVSGNVVVNNTYRQSDAATLILNVSSKEDVVTIAGAATLDGTLQINFTDGFIPEEGMTLLHADSMTGSFDKVEIKGVNTPLEITYGEKEITIGTKKDQTPGDNAGTTDTGNNDGTEDTGNDNTQTDAASKVGKTYTVGNYKYKVTRDSKERNEVRLVGIAKQTSDVKVAASVKIENKSYKITAVGAKAFKGKKKIKKVTIGKNVVSIGKEAFSGCTGLKTVKIGTGVKKIETKAFYNCKNVSNFAIYTKKLTSKTVGKNAFAKMGSTKYSKMKVKVPAAKQKSYRKILQNAGVSKKAKIQKLTDK